MGPPVLGPPFAGQWRLCKCKISYNEIYLILAGPPMPMGQTEPIMPILGPPVLPSSPYNPYGGPVQVMFDEQSDDEVI